MQEKHLYEYAVVRYVPRVEREEFVNVGLLMMCKRSKWIKAAISVPYNKINTFDNELTKEQLENQLGSFVKIANGNHSDGFILAYPVEERFRWLTSVKSASIQTSRPHPGYCMDLEATFLRLFKELVE